MNEKGGVLGRKLELRRGRRSVQPATAVRIYEKLITQDKVDLVLGPYSSPLTEAVANVTEKHRMPMVAPNAGATSIFRKGGSSSSWWPSRGAVSRRVDRSGRKKGAQDRGADQREDALRRSDRQGAIELAKKRGPPGRPRRSLPKGTTDFSAILSKVRAANPDVLGAATYFEDAVAITRQLKALDMNPKMYGADGRRGPPKFYESSAGTRSSSTAPRSGSRSW